MNQSAANQLDLISQDTELELKPKRPAKRAPKDFQASGSILDFGRQHGFSESEILDEIAAFKDHTFASAKTDWPATFRNWLRKSEQWKSGQAHKNLTYAERLALDIKKLEQKGAYHEESIFEQRELIGYVTDE